MLYGKTEDSRDSAIPMYPLSICCIRLSHFRPPIQTSPNHVHPVCVANGRQNANAPLSTRQAARVYGQSLGGSQHARVSGRAGGQRGPFSTRTVSAGRLLAGRQHSAVAAAWLFTIRHMPGDTPFAERLTNPHNAINPQIEVSRKKESLCHRLWSLDEALCRRHPLLHVLQYRLHNRHRGRMPGGKINVRDARLLDKPLNYGL